MAAEIGYFALVLALFVSAVQSAGPLVAARRRDPAVAALVDQAALGQFMLLAVAFASLTFAFVTSDFSVEVVAANSHTTKPLLYKIAGVWGNHEGSMLLWVLILSLFGAAVPIFGHNLPDRLRINVLGVHGMLGMGFLAFITLTSNPFARARMVVKRRLTFPASICPTCRYPRPEAAASCRRVSFFCLRKTASRRPNLRSASSFLSMQKVV